MVLSKVLSSSSNFEKHLFFFVFFLYPSTTSTRIEHGGVVGSDSTRTILEPLMPMSSALLPLVLSLSCAKFISNIRGGDTVVINPGGPIARVNAGVLLNQGLEPEPLRSSVGWLGFIDCIVYNRPSCDRDAGDVKHFKGFSSKPFCSWVSNKSWILMHSKPSSLMQRHGYIFYTI